MITQKTRKTMTPHFEKVKFYLDQLEYSYSYLSEEEGVFVVKNKKRNIHNLVIGVAEPILLMEQYMFDLSGDSVEVFKTLLKKNRDMVHGAFVLDDEGERVIFRDTLQIENLDLNELEGSLDSLSLLMDEFSEEVKQFST